MEGGSHRHERKASWCKEEANEPYSHINQMAGIRGEIN